jgi:ABC-type cobalamin/Fe3+-siderophores transport system ATPase subunit
MAQALLMCASGLMTPLRGSVRLGGVNPFRSPKLRAHFPVLLADEPSLPRPTPTGEWLRLFDKKPKTVAETITAILKTRRNFTSEPEINLEKMPLISGLLKRPALSLDDNERRRVSLAISLSHPSPQALLLYEPLANLNPSEALWATELLRRRALDGVIVVIATLRERTARRLSSRTFLMQPRNPRRRTPQPSKRQEEPRPSKHQEDEMAKYVVHCSNRDTLCSDLQAESALCEKDDILFDRVFIKHADEDHLLRTLVSTCVDDDIELSELYRDPSRHGEPRR